MNESPKTVILGVSVLLVMVALVVGGVLMLQRVSLTRTQILAEEARLRARSIAGEARDRTREIDAEARADLASGREGSDAVRALVDGVAALLTSAEHHLSQGRTEAGLALLDAAVAQLEQPVLRAAPTEALVNLHRRASAAFERAGNPAAALSQIEAALNAGRSLPEGDMPAEVIAEIEAIAARLKPPVQPGEQR